MKWAFHELANLSLAKVLAFSFALLVLCASAIGVFTWIKAQETERIGNFVMTYYQNPQPEKVVDMIFRAERAGIFDNTSAKQGFGGFLVGVFTKNPDRLDDWFAKLSSLRPNHYEFALISLAYVGTPESKAALRRIAGKSRTDEKELIEIWLKQGTVRFEDRPLTDVGMIDVLWAEFFATGDERYVNKIADVIKPDNELHGGSILLSGAAKWSMESNAQTHPKVRDIYAALKREHPELDDATPKQPG